MPPMATDRLQERIAAFATMLDRLAAALARPRDEFMRDSVIQRFEFTFELAWKMLKLRLEAEGLEARTPREVLQEALQAGFIEDGNAWSSLLRMRNLCSHTYDEGLADEVYAFVQGTGLALFRTLRAKSGAWMDLP